METQNTNSRYTMMWIAGIAITLFSIAGIAAIMGWIPTSIAGGGSTANVASTPATAAKAPAPKSSNNAAAPTRLASNTPSRSVCADCGIIESSREITEKGTGSGVGGVGGAVVGGVLGHQVGGGRGKDLATVAGAIGGAFAGNEIEKRVKSTTSYEVTVRFEGGATRTFNEDTPKWRVGDRVRVVDGVIRSNG